jgi:hypothetical protein
MKQAFTSRSYSLHAHFSSHGYIVLSAGEIGATPSS